VTETIKVIPAEKMFLEQVWLCLAVPRWVKQWQSRANCSYV